MHKTLSLEDVCECITDGSHFSPEATTSGFPMLSIKDMRDYGFDYSNCKHISKDAFEQLVSQGCLPKKDDLLIAKDGNSYLEHIFVKDNDNLEVILSSVAIIRVKKELLNPYYLMYYLSNPTYLQYLRDNAVSGSAIPRVVLKTFKKMKVTVPPLSEQEKIVSILKTIDDKIRCNSTINDNLGGIYFAS